MASRPSRISSQDGGFKMMRRENETWNINVVFGRIVPHLEQRDRELADYCLRDDEPMPPTAISYHKLKMLLDDFK